jgi:hypothetical protein
LDQTGECWIWTVAGYIGNGDADSTCYVRKTYDQYQSLKLTDRNGLPNLPAFGILKDYPVTKGHQDTINFYLASKDSYDTSVKVTLKYTVCGQETILLADSAVAYFLLSRDGTIPYHPVSDHTTWYQVTHTNMDTILYPLATSCTIDQYHLVDYS